MQICSEILKSTKIDWGFIAHAGYVHPEIFICVYLRQNYEVLPLQNIHINMLNSLAHGEQGRKINIQAPRGAGKSTLNLRWRPLYRICYKAFDIACGHPPEEFILLISRNESLAKKHMRDIKRVITYNKDVIRDFGDLKGDLWAAKEMQTKNGVIIVPLGRSQSPRGALVEGKRPTTIYLDDVEDPKRCLNPDLREEDEEWFYTDVMFASDIGGKTNYIFVDTNKHPESLSQKLMESYDWDNQFYQAIINPQLVYHPEYEHLWKEWEQFYRDITIDDQKREELAQKYFEANKEEMMDGVQELWPEELSYLKVRKYVIERGYHEVLRELQNIARDPGAALFNMDDAITFRVEENGFRRSDGRLVFWKDIGGFTTYIDTMGGRDSLENSFSCAVVIAWEVVPGGRTMKVKTLSSANGYVLLCWMDRVALTEQMSNAVMLHQRAEAMMLHIKPKSNFVCEQRPDPDGTILTAHNLAFNKACQDHDFPHNVSYHTQNQNKEERIATLEPLIANGWLCFNEQGLPQDFWKQFQQFPSADHNDAPDAVQGACRARVQTTMLQREYEDMRRERQRSHLTL